MFLLDSILLAPVKGIVWLGKKIDEVIKTEQGENRLKDTLLELQMRLELGEFSEEEYRRQEASLLERLEAICEKKAEE